MREVDKEVHLLERGRQWGFCLGQRQIKRRLPVREAENDMLSGVRGRQRSACL